MKKGYIICVDDQPAILDSLMSQLENAVGELCEIESAESANEALELLEDLSTHGEQVEMVISDEVMPGMKGSELLAQVHTHNPDIIKVMLTGQAGLKAVAYAVNHANLDKYFTKPWEYEDLKLTVQNLLEKGRLARNNKQLSQELQERYKELEQTYHKLSFAYTQLKETQEQLIHAERLSVIGQLSSGIIHEVKNQLNMINFAELIQEAYSNDERVQKYTGYILEAGRNIYNLVDEMRRFAKKEQRHYEMEMSSVTAVLDNVLNFMRFDTLLMKRHVITDFQESPSTLLNKEKLGQVFINLLRNATYATNDHSGEITLRITTIENQIVITIQDNGCGIPEDALPRIWEPFFTTKGEDGTGLGLDICKRIIEEHNGTISCTSRLNAGTTFTIKLPLIEQDHNRTIHNP